jgi:hypothetical protein
VDGGGDVDEDGGAREGKGLAGWGGLGSTATTEDWVRFAGRCVVQAAGEVPGQSASHGDDVGTPSRRE